MNITFEVSTPEVAEAIADKLIEAARENAQRRDSLLAMLDGVEEENLSRRWKERLRDYCVRETKAAGGASEELYAIAAAVRVQACIEKDR